MDVDYQLTGQFTESNVEADVDSVIEEIKAAMYEEQERQERMSEPDDEDY